MKRELKQFMLIISFALISVIACKKSEPLAPPKTALRITGGIESATRASNTAWDKGDQIGIYMFAAGTNNIAENAVNIAYKTENGDGNFIPVGKEVYFPMDGSNVDFLAWYPYTKGEEWRVNLVNQQSQADLDLMTAEAKSNTSGQDGVYNKEKPAVHFNFAHRLTKLTLDITAGAGIEASDLKGLKAEITKQRKTVFYQHEFNGVGSEKEEVTIPLLTRENGAYAEAILFPDDLAGERATGRQLVFTLKATGEKFSWNIPDTKLFEAGKRNIYTITIHRTAISVTSEVLDWESGNGDGENVNAE